MISKRLRITAPSPRETVLLFPTFGYYSERKRQWLVPLCGALYEPNVLTLRRRLALRVLRRLMKVSAEEMNSDIFRRRISAFLCASRRRRLVLTTGNLTFRLPPNRRDGLFFATLRIAEEDLNGNAQLTDNWLHFQVVMPQQDHRTFLGRAQLLHDQGVTVISDVDDTIKHTEVWSRRALLRNTFLRDFQSVDGMAERYQSWSDQGAAFHYVTSSPWQLYEALAELHQTAGFPGGSFHLRAFRWRDQLVRRLLLWPPYSKYLVIRRLINTFRRRKFILIGDSGERDPEIYGNLARRFPDRVAAIFIRVVPGRPWSERRARKAFHRVPAQHWSCFSSADELPRYLPAEWMQ